nr:hypothetical protein [Tanacetum cinerariifolium]
MALQIGGFNLPGGGIGEPIERRKVDEDVQDGVVAAYLHDRDLTTQEKEGIVVISAVTGLSIGSSLRHSQSGQSSNSNATLKPKMWFMQQFRVLMMVEMTRRRYKANLNKMQSQKVKERSRKGQNRIKTGQKREAWRSREMLNAVTVDRARKTEENKKRMNEKANTVGKLFKFNETRKDKGLNCNFKEVQREGPKLPTVLNLYHKDGLCN